MSECGFRIERGSYFVGPCRLPSGHEYGHSPYAPGQRDTEFERTFGFPPTVSVDTSTPAEKYVLTPLDALMALARSEHPEWWRAWEWIEAHASALEDQPPPYPGELTDTQGNRWRVEDGPDDKPADAAQSESRCPYCKKRSDNGYACAACIKERHLPTMDAYQNPSSEGSK